MNCLHNPLGEGAHTIIKVFEETPRLRTLCGLEEGVEQIDWSKSGKGPADVALLAAELKAGHAAFTLIEIAIAPTTDDMSQQIMDAASELSCKRLRASQMLAFSLALHSRLGDDCVVRDNLQDEDVCMLLSRHVYAVRGHEVLCSRLGQDHPWFEVKVLQPSSSFGGFGATTSSSSFGGFGAAPSSSAFVGFGVIPVGRV